MGNNSTIPKKPLIISIEGLIGAGKTEFIKVLLKELKSLGYKVKHIDEPVNTWSECGILENFYNDKKRWGYTFQTIAYSSRIQHIVNIYNNDSNNNDLPDIYIAERGPHTDMLFEKMLFEDKFIKEMEHNMYLTWCQSWNLAIPSDMLVDGFIYLCPGVDEAMNRIAKRGRPEEIGKIDKSYQVRLEEKHNEFLLGENKFNWLKNNIEYSDEYTSELISNKFDNPNDLFEVNLNNDSYPCLAIYEKENFMENNEIKNNLVNKVINFIKILQLNNN